MSHLLFWPSVTFFYPIGNTSAVCLTESLPLEEKADILLLACGDPRHILYTVYVNSVDSSTDMRGLDITCCDVEAAVLARNALLFTLLADEGAENKLDNLWNIFYHMLIDQSSLSILLAQCRKLVDLSENLDAWRAGPYAHFLTTCDAATLAELRRFWTLYIDNANLSPRQAKRFQQMFRDGMRDTSRRTGTSNAASRSAGPLAPYASEAVSRQFDSFWSTGVTDDGSRTTSQSLSVNPTFAFSMDGGKFAVHYGTDPLAGFHLAEPFASGKYTPSTKPIPPQELVRTAREQFSRWCTAVIKLLSLKNGSTSPAPFVVRMFAGDVLMFCQAINYCAVMKSTTTPFEVASWRLSRIEFDGHCYGANALSPAPTSFNVIDTSNVLDHIGLINLLIATASLLSRTPSATLYTEALLRKGGDPSRAILEHLCGDLSTMSLLLGVVPSTFVSRFTTRSNIHETMSMSEESKQYHERLAWRAIGTHCASDAPLRAPSFSPGELAAFLFRVYLNLFSDEDIVLRFESLSLPPFGMVRNLQRSGIIHYNRRSFALLVHHAQSMVHADWPVVMDLFEDFVLADTRLLIGKHYYQELCCHLHLLGMYTPAWMSVPRIRALHENTAHAPFRDWTSVPQVVNVVLVVPRNVISQLEPEFRDIGTPIFQCDITAGPLQTNFAAISASFGRLETTGIGENKTGIVVEDKVWPPWSSNSPLIVTFSAPSSCLLISAIESDAPEVGLTLYGTPAVANKFMRKLGFLLTMYRARLGDAEHVQVLAQRPDVRTAGASVGVVDHADPMVTLKPPLPDVSNPRCAYTHVEMGDLFSTIESLTIGVDITDPKASAALIDPRTNIIISPISVQTAYLKIGSHRQIVAFPLPVDFANAELRVARWLQYVEIVVPLVPLEVNGERSVSRMFSSFLERGSPMLGSIHRINMDCCPLLKLPQSPTALVWYQIHAMLMFSEREKHIASKGLAATLSDTLLCVKETIHTILVAAAGGPNGDAPPKTVFSLFDPLRRVNYLYIIVAGIRLDVGSHTVVVDAFVAPSSDTVRKALSIALCRAASMGSMGSELEISHVLTDGDEAAAWRHLLPLLTERCRTWKHRPTCAYRSQPAEGPLAPALSPTDAWERRSPLCACGAGVGTEVLPAHFKSLSPYLVRAAFSPLFSVSYLEESLASVISREIVQGLHNKISAESGVGCRSCGKKPDSDGQSRLLACSRCKNAKYCSKECQVKDWKEHKKACKKV